MFGQLRWRDYKRVDDYNTALAHVTSIKPLRGSTDGWVPLRGVRSKRNPTKAKVNADGTITFRLHQTDAVTWFPDNSIVLRGYRSRTTADFINGYTPGGVDYKWTHGLLVLRDPGTHWWVLDESNPQHRSYIVNPSLRVASCAHGESVRLHLVDGKYQFDEDSLTPFEWLEVDKARRQHVLLKYHFADFLAWERAVNALSDDDRPQPRYLEQTAALNALMEMDFKEARECVPASIVCRRVNGNWVNVTKGMQKPAIQKLRREAYRREGAVIQHSAKIMTWPDWERCVRRGL